MAKILYAEDDKVTRENYAIVLSRYFDEVITAEDGEEALVLYRQHRPDALLLDIKMPRLDGLDVIAVIRKEDRSVPIAVLTAHSDREKLLRAIPLGLTGYAVKPLRDADFKALVESIKETLSKNRKMLLDGDLSWDGMHEVLLYKEETIPLSQKEKQLLSLLAKYAGYYRPKELIIAEIWDGETIDASHDLKLSQLVYRLHRKLTQRTGEKQPLIENSYALGYRLRMRTQRT